tara:strand:- start:23212 stop:24315 length:1104 start_codon:yes stop_codon:yes gene_type:complete
MLTLIFLTQTIEKYYYKRIYLKLHYKNIQMVKLKIIKNDINKSASIDKIIKWLHTDISKVNKTILEGMSSNIPLIPELAGYIITSGGKRIRPILTLACSRLCKYSGERHVNLAAGIEFIHTATLLHDDVVDESNQRRGKKSANLVWGNKSSILVGDFLLSKAFRLIIEDGSNQCLDILSKASLEISQGEVLQLLTNNNVQTTESKYLEVINAKTAELFAAACSLGGVVSECGKEKIEALFDFGRYLGIAFQIIDDALDYDHKNKKFGKNIGDDFKEGKVSLPIILAYTRGNKKEKDFLIKVINKNQQDKTDLAKVLKIIDNYDIIRDCVKKAKHFSTMAQDSLGPFEESFEKNMLHELATFASSRTY